MIGVPLTGPGDPIRALFFPPYFTFFIYLSLIQLRGYSSFASLGPGEKKKKKTRGWGVCVYIWQIISTLNVRTYRVLSPAPEEQAHALHRTQMMHHTLFINMLQITWMNCKWCCLSESGLHS